MLSATKASREAGNARPIHAGRVDERISGQRKVSERLQYRTRSHQIYNLIPDLILPHLTATDPLSNPNPPLHLSK